MQILYSSEIQIIQAEENSYDSTIVSWQLCY